MTADHDPLLGNCLYHGEPSPASTCGMCVALLAREARVRADERQRIANWREELAEAKEMLATRDEAWYAGVSECVAVVEVLPYGTGTIHPDGRWVNRDTLLAALRALLPEEER